MSVSMSLTITEVSDSLTSRRFADSRTFWYRLSAGLARSANRLETFIGSNRGERNSMVANPALQGDVDFISPDCHFHISGQPNPPFRTADLFNSRNNPEACARLASPIASSETLLPLR